MGRKVKCLNCHKQGDSDNYHKELIKGKNRYFCNEFEYMEYESKIKIDQLKKESRNELVTWIVEKYFDYQPGMIFPTVLLKRLNKLFEFYPLYVIKETFIKNDNILLWAKDNKDFTNDFGKTSYFMTIIESNINDVYKEYNKEQLEIKKELEKKSKVDVDLFSYMESEPIQNNSIKNNKDISRFLED